MTSNGMEVAILAMPQATASPIYGMQELLAAPGRDWPFMMTGVPGESLIDPHIASSTGQRIEMLYGAIARPTRRLTPDYTPDAACVLEVMVDPASGPGDAFHHEAEWLRGYWERGGTIATACTGAILLGEAGLLEGQDATTHWGFCDFMAARYPGVRVHPDRILVATGQDQRLIMAGGGTSWMDLGLYLVARLCGGEEAVRAARVHLIDWHQSGQQAFASLHRNRQVRDAMVERAQAWIADHYDQSSPVRTMAEISGLGERTFKRRFRKATGMTPMEYVLTLRLEEAKQILEATDEPVEAVAEMVGYEDASFFSRKFRARVGLTPAAYRRKFQRIRRIADIGGAG